MMGDDGWQQSGVNAWHESISEATGMPTIPGGHLSRRTVRHVRTGHLTEDLWRTKGTSEILLRRAFRNPVDIDVVVEMNSKVASADGESSEEQLMDGKDATRYRAVVARLYFIAIDRGDVQYATNDAARRMARPVKCDWPLVKHIAMYLIGRPRAVHLFQWQDRSETMTIYVDSN